MDAFDEVRQIVAALRGEDGCPWDRAQTERSLRPHLLEEAHEVIEAIDADDDDALATELGDLQFVLTLLGRIASERGAFDEDAPLERIAAKMRRRHPHVFDPAHVRSAADSGITAWELRKAGEAAADAPSASALDGVPGALPALQRAQRLQAKASAVGFDWPEISGVRAKLEEELGELEAAVATGETEAIAHELGDVLFTVVNLARFLEVDAESAARAAARRFERRFRAVEATVAEAGATLAQTDLDTLEAHWQAAKASERSR